MQEYFFSDDNIANQTKKLIFNLELTEDQLNKDVILKCKKIIVNHMKDTYTKYGKIKPTSTSTQEYLKQLNKKSLSDCLRLITNKKQEQVKPIINQQNKSPNLPSKIKNVNFDQSVNFDKPLNYEKQSNYMRPNEIMNKLKNPSHPSQQNNPSKEYQSYSDAGGYASFSTLDNAGGPFITATGEYGLPLEMQADNPYNSVNGNDNKKNFSDELDQKISQLQGRYGGVGGMGGMGQVGQMGGMSQPNQGGSTPYYGVPQQNAPNQIDPIVAKLLNLENSNATLPPGMNLPSNNPTNNNLQQQLNQLVQQITQMQQSGQIDPQILGNLMQQMQNIQKQIGQTSSPVQPNTIPTIPTTNPTNVGVDYSFSGSGENMGNDFNAAFGGGGMYSGVDSLEETFKPLTPMGGADDTDLGRKLEIMKSERENINSKMSNVPKTENFDPMKSPYQQNQQNQNNQNSYNDSFFFLKSNSNENKPTVNQLDTTNSSIKTKVKTQDFNEKLKELSNTNEKKNTKLNAKTNEKKNNKNEKKDKNNKNDKNDKKDKNIKNVKKKVLSIKDVELLNEYDDFDDEEIEKEILALEMNIKNSKKNISTKKQTKKIFIEDNEINDKKNTDYYDQDTDNNSENKKKALLKLLINLKNDETLNNDNQKDIYENFSSINQINENSPMNLIINSKKSNIIIEDDIIQYNTNNINDILEKKIKLEKTFLNINCNEITEKECYNDYMIPLNKKIRIDNINLKNINMPIQNEENITNNNNKLNIEYNGIQKTFEIEPNYYNRHELVYFVNEGFKINEINVSCEINKDDKYSFYSNDNSKFNMTVDENSILIYLGFNKTFYLNRSIYTAENCLNIGDNIFFLIIENISEEPMFLINKDENSITKLQPNNINKEIDHLIIKFYKNKNNIIKNNKEYSFFFENNHNLEFEIN